jgi:single-stranded-DNA-specific exonuclease
MEYKWNIKELPARADMEEMMGRLQVPWTVAVLLLQRGIHSFEEAKDFFRPDLNALHDPYLMADMDKAVERILKAVANNERILVYGDYDVDGTTSVALMSSFLRKKHPKIETYIPDRYNEGYGVSEKGIHWAYEHGVDLIITLDCGIKAKDKIALANKMGIDVIVCDHHNPGNDLPPALAVLDPKRPDCDYPYKELCGCGVGFKLAQALAAEWDMPFDTLDEYLDLVALAIGADIVPITGENRILAFHGLRRINEDPRPGIKACLEVASVKKVLSISDVVFKIAPRINAAGRIEHGKLAVELLCSESMEHALTIAEQVNEHNRTRQDLDKSITAQAIQMIEDSGEQNRKSTVLYHPEWHKGVIGIVASRLIENYYRPTIVFTESKGVLSGSARSVRGYDLYSALEQCADILEQFGGHMYAAGMTLLPERFPEFKERFEEVVSNTITPDQLVPKMDIDMIVPLNEITPKFFRIIQQFAPFGPGNMTPVLASLAVSDTGYSRAVGETLDHLKLTVRDSSGAQLHGIAFGMGGNERLVKSGNPISIAYHLDENEWNGQTSIQLMVRDMKA